MMSYVVYIGASGFYVGTLPPQMPIPTAADERRFADQQSAERHADNLNRDNVSSATVEGDE